MGHYYYCNMTQKNRNTTDAVAFIHMPTKAFKCKIYTVVPQYPGDTVQDPQWIPESTDSTKPYIYCFFLYITMIKFNL